jgi:hypothetical protein
MTLVSGEETLATIEQRCEDPIHERRRGQGAATLFSTRALQKLATVVQLLWGAGENCMGQTVMFCCLASTSGSSGSLQLFSDRHRQHRWSFES